MIWCTDSIADLTGVMFPFEVEHCVCRRVRRRERD